MSNHRFYHQLYQNRSPFLVKKKLKEISISTSQVIPPENLKEEEKPEEQLMVSLKTQTYQDSEEDEKTSFDSDQN